MRAVIPQAAQLGGGQTAATHLGGANGLLAQAAVARGCAGLSHQAAAGMVRGPAPLHGKPSRPFLLLLGSKPRQLRTSRSTHPSRPCRSPGAGDALAWLLCRPRSSCTRMMTPGNPPRLPSGMLPGRQQGDTSGQCSCAVSSLHTTT